MASMISSSNKMKMLTGMREEAGRFRKDLDILQEDLLNFARKVTYEPIDAIVNGTAGLNEALTENLEVFDSTLNEMAEIWLKGNVGSEWFENELKKFIDSKVNLRTDYETFTSPDGEDNYQDSDNATYSEAMVEAAKIRKNFLSEVEKYYSTCAGDDIAALILPAFKKLEDMCNGYITEAKSLVDAQAALDSRLKKAADNMSNVAAGMKMEGMEGAKKRKFGNVNSSKYTEGDL